MELSAFGLTVSAWCCGMVARARSAEGLPRGHGAQRVRRAWSGLSLRQVGRLPYTPRPALRAAPPTLFAFS